MSREAASSTAACWAGADSLGWREAQRGSHPAGAGLVEPPLGSYEGSLRAPRSL